MRGTGPWALGGIAIVAVAALLVTGGASPELSERGVVGTTAGSDSPPQHAKASRSRAVLPVRALGRLRAPDLYVAAKGVTPAQVSALRRLRGVKAVSVIATATVTVGATSYELSAVDPSSVRAFTPKATARSDALWAAVARGDLAASYAAALPLDRTVTLLGRPIRIGALAVFGLPATDLVVSRQVGAGLGLRDNAVVIAAPKRRLSNLRREVRAVLGRAADVTVLRPAALQHRRPSTYRGLYQLSAGYCPGLSWKVLAAVGQVESGHGRNLGPSSAGALGPMQFLPSTWAFAGVDGDGDGRADIMSPYDAVPAAALLLCRAGAGRGGRALYRALYSYNHADWYVREVLDLAARYR